MKERRHYCDQLIENIQYYENKKTANIALSFIYVPIVFLSFNDN